MRAWQSLLRAHSALVRRLSAELESEHDLPLAWYEVLLRLKSAPEHRMRMQELAGSTFFSPSGMTRLVDRMVQAGLVERHLCDTDRRVHYAAVTDEGIARLRAASGLHLRGIEEHFGSRLDDEEAEALARALDRVATRLGAAPLPD
ncbi:MAG: hypothetical protein QOI20_45 [Acidimicrobiaceae bacterium]|jgi:DNA-binding MarR family transcriptional regulator|nr:hypothetical protein [Acidimicrobiaceae bacterium]